MKPSTLRWLGLTAAAAASVLCWHLLTMEPDATPRTVGKSPARPAQVTGKEIASSPAHPLPKFGTTEFKSTLHERGLKWLDLHGRNAGNLIAIFDLTGDKALLAEAAEMFPNDPLVCVVMARQFLWETKPWIERLIAAEPANPEGPYLKASALMKKTWEFNMGEDRPGAIAALSQAASMPGPRNDHLAERMQTVREAALAMGVAAGDAVRVALDLILPPRRTYASESLNREALFTEMQEAKASGSEDRVSEIRHLGLSTAEKFFDRQQLTIRDEMDANQLKAVMLDSHTNDIPLPDYILAGNMARDAVKARRSELAELHHREEETWAVLRTASDDVMVAYYDLFMASGEFEARRWVLSRPTKAN